MGNYKNGVYCTLEAYVAEQELFVVRAQVMEAGVTTSARLATGVSVAEAEKKAIEAVTKSSNAIADAMEKTEKLKEALDADVSIKSASALNFSEPPRSVEEARAVYAYCKPLGISRTLNKEEVKEFCTNATIEQILDLKEQM